MIEITSEMKELIADANGAILRLKDWYKANEDAFGMMDLKLYDLSWYMYEDFKEDFPLTGKRYSQDELFEWFCQISYDDFDEWCKEETGWELRKYQTYVGRTSKFYLHAGQMIYKDQLNLYGIIEHFYDSYSSDVDFDDDGNIDVDATFGKDFDDWYSSETEMIDRIRDELEYIAKEMYNDVTKLFVDNLKVYEYIKNFKANQVQYFKEWVQYYEDELIMEKAEADKYAAERIKICDEFKDATVRSIVINSNIDNENIRYLVNAIS